MAPSPLLLLAIVLPCLAMDMDMGGGGTPWLDTPVMLHSSRADTCKLTPEQCAYRSGFWRYWYKADYRYARTTVYFILAMIGLFTVSNIIRRITPQSVQRSGFWRYTQASLRHVGYRGYRLRIFGWYSPSLAYLLVGLAGAVFFFGMTLGPKPYYWPNKQDGSLSFGSSPPIATRTGWMAVGLLPFVVCSVLAAKANWVTALTGVSHEKLQVFHRWTSYAMFVLALVHTFPFIVYHIWYGDMVKKWKTDMVYWTGVVALIFQAYLTFMSIGPIRNRFYEFFKATHFIAAFTFIIFFFFHCDFRLTSWDYFIVTGTLYLSSLLFSQLRTFLAYGSSHTAVLRALPNDHLSITIRLRPSVVARQAVPLELVWRPGQHVFLRFFAPKGLSWWRHSVSAHPFTICSLPPADEASSFPAEKGGVVGREDAVLRFVVKPMHASGGLTARLHALALERPQGAEVGVTLDGPYGGIGVGGAGNGDASSSSPARSRLAAFDRVLVIVGGSGAGFSLPVVEEVLRAASDGRPAEKGARAAGGAKEVKIVVATRDVRTRGWYSEEIRGLLERYGYGAGGVGDELAVKVAVHVTGETAAEEEAGVETAPAPVEGEKRVRVGDDGLVAWRQGRPQLRNIIKECAAEAEGDSLAIAVCGPAGMLYDVRNAAAEVQAGVLSGKGAREVYLHSEHFSW
ncbi:Ferric reductase transmembrane component 6 [Lasiodiplodia theobromae]|uniref:Ferric reductase transmembrane component 6 n=1 Tax=Lasiodiplodia theobromae TaxID=45133 RepID=A0A5N5D9S3_9PEZI|nr:Ferric reductase transmembrane component 6 [Lasiodiplodia theobromae]